MFKLQKGLSKRRQRFFKILFLKTRFFIKKLKNVCTFDHPILFKFHQQVIQAFVKECVERLQTSNVSISNGSGEEF